MMWSRIISILMVALLNNIGVCGKGENPPRARGADNTKKKTQKRQHCGDPIHHQLHHSVLINPDEFGQADCHGPISFATLTQNLLSFFGGKSFSLFYRYHNHQNSPNATTMAKYSPPSIFAATSLPNKNRICKRVYFSRQSQICHAFGRSGKLYLIFDGRKYPKIVPMALTSTTPYSP